MPERRRPGLWKTLVAAAQTAIDRVADGVDTLADGAEALADGLRSLGRAKPPPLPTDPRLAGVDPTLAAYVAAHDPVWFSFEAPGGPTLVDTMPPSEWDAASAPIRREAVASNETAAAADPPVPRMRPRRGAPSAAELPAGRPVPQRVVFRRRRRESDAGRSFRATTAGSASAPSWRRPASAPDADAATATGNAEGASSAPGRPVRASPSADAAADATRAPASESSSAPAPHPARADARFAERAAAVAFQARPAPAAANTAARPEPTAPKRRAPFESLRQTSPMYHSPSAPGGPAGNVAPGRQQNRSVPPSSTATRSTPSAPGPAPWPELPPSSWSTPPAGDGGALAWSGASAADVLIDEQRST